MNCTGFDTQGPKTGLRSYEDHPRRLGGDHPNSFHRCPILCYGAFAFPEGAVNSRIQFFMSPRLHSNGAIKPYRLAIDHRVVDDMHCKSSKLIGLAKTWRVRHGRTERNPHVLG